VIRDHKVTKVTRGREVLKDQQVQQDSKDLKEVRHRVLKDRKEILQKVSKVILVTHHKVHRVHLELKEVVDPREAQVIVVLDLQVQLEHPHKVHRDHREMQTLVVQDLQGSKDRQDLLV
jgi:predicted phage tail protein